LHLHSFEEPPSLQKFFSSVELKAIVGFFKLSYFDHFNLYNFVLKKDKQKETFRELVYIDAVGRFPRLDEGTMIELPSENSKQLLTRSSEAQRQDPQGGEQPEQAL